MTEHQKLKIRSKVFIVCAERGKNGKPTKYEKSKNDGNPTNCTKSKHYGQPNSYNEGGINWTANDEQEYTDGTPTRI